MDADAGHTNGPGAVACRTADDRLVDDKVAVLHKV